MQVSCLAQQTTSLPTMLTSSPRKLQIFPPQHQRLLRPLQQLPPQHQRHPQRHPAAHRLLLLLTKWSRVQPPTPLPLRPPQHFCPLIPPPPRLHRRFQLRLLQPQLPPRATSPVRWSWCSSCPSTARRCPRGSKPASATSKSRPSRTLLRPRRSTVACVRASALSPWFCCCPHLRS